MKDQNELDAIFGPASQESVVEQIPGYDMKHIAWCIAQDWCFEGLSDNSIDVVELVSEAGGPPFLAYVVNDRVYPVSLEEVEMCCPDEDDF